jgi:tetratricopeptide (TPR) repeat protein
MPLDLVHIILDRAQNLQQLAAAGETTPDLRYAEGAGLNELAIALQYIGDLKAARDAANRSLAVSLKMLADNPKELRVRVAIGIDHKTMGNILLAMGQREDALASYRKSAAIYEELAAERPDDLEVQDHLQRLLLRRARPRVDQRQ